MDVNLASRARRLVAMAGESRARPSRREASSGGVALCSSHFLSPVDLWTRIRACRTVSTLPERLRVCTIAQRAACEADPGPPTQHERLGSPTGYHT